MTGTTSTDVPRHDVTVREGDGHPAAALVALIATYLVAAAAIALMVLNRPEWHVGQWYFLVDLADAIVYGAVGWVLLSRLGRPVVWLVVGCAFGGAVAALSMQWTEYQAERPDLPALPLLASAQSWAWIPGTLALILVAPWLVRRGPLDRVGRIGATVGAAVSVGHMLVRWTDPYPWPEGSSVMPFAIRDTGWLDRIEQIDRGFNAAIVVVGLAAAADVARRWYAAATIDARRGLGWLAVGGALMTVAFAPLALPAAWTADLPVATTPLIHLASQLFFPAALLVAVLGQQLWGLRLTVSRAVAWTLLTAVLVAGYAVLVSVLGLLLPGLADGVEQLAAAALLAAAVDPIRRFVQRRVDRLVHGDARRPLDAVDRVGSRLGAASDPTRLVSGVLDGIVESLRLAGASIDVAAAGSTQRIAVGRDGTEGVVLPLVLDGDLIGSLTAWPRPGERLDQVTRRALDALVPTVAVAALLAVKADELAESRARVVHARDEERRAVRRELHDGLGPALAGVGYGIAAARTMLTSDPAGAGHLLDRLQCELDSRVEEVRALAREMVPPILIEAGLAPALLELADRHRMGGLDVVVDVDRRIELGSTTDHALYGIASEALRNVVRHAQATRCRISLHVDHGSVELSVCDDGVGIAPGRPSGVGLQSMRERADAIGAQLSVAPGASGGAEVRVRIPTWRGATT
jgi:signal transduction histidine kinase